MDGLMRPTGKLGLEMMVLARAFPLSAPFPNKTL